MRQGERQAQQYGHAEQCETSGSASWTALRLGWAQLLRIWQAPLRMIRCGVEPLGQTTFVPSGGYQRRHRSRISK